MSVYRIKPSYGAGSKQFRYQLTLAIIIANVIVFLVTLSTSTWEIANWATQLLAQRNDLVLMGQWWRLFTAMWLHFDFEHIAFNMLALCMFGIILENIVRRWQFIVIYFSAGLVGNLGSLALSFTNAPSLGASGCIFGILAAALIAQRGFLQQKMCLAFGYIVYYLIASIGPGVDSWAHIFGAVAGALLIFAFTPSHSGTDRQDLSHETPRVIPREPPREITREAPSVPYNPSRFFASEQGRLTFYTCPYCREVIPVGARKCPFCNPPIPSP